MPLRGVRKKLRVEPDAPSTDNRSPITDNRQKELPSTEPGDTLPRSPGSFHSPSDAQRPLRAPPPSATNRSRPPRLTHRRSHSATAGRWQGPTTRTCARARNRRRPRHSTPYISLTSASSFCADFFAATTSGWFQDRRTSGLRRLQLLGRRRLVVGRPLPPVLFELGLEFHASFPQHHPVVVWRMILLLQLPRLLHLVRAFRNLGSRCAAGVRIWAECV